MKTIKNIILLGLLALTGCNDDMGIENQVPSATKTVEFIATTEDAVSSESGSRTQLQDDGLSVGFKLGDKIKVYDGATTKELTAEKTMGSYVSFGKTDMADVETYYAAYPATGVGSFTGTSVKGMLVPNEQSAPKGGYDPKANVSVAIGKKVKTGTYELQFRNTCNLVKFTITEQNHVTAVVIKGNNSEYLAGKVDIDITTNTYSNIQSGRKQIIMIPEGGGEFAPGDYYAAVLPQTYAKGISVKMEHAEGTYHFKRGNVTNLQMKRNKIYRLFNGAFSDYTQVGMLPSLYLHTGNVGYENLSNIQKIVFHVNTPKSAMENYELVNKLSTSRPAGSDVVGVLSGDGLTLDIYTHYDKFSIPDAAQAFTGDGSQMFYNYQKLKEIEGLNNIDVTFVKSFKNLFSNCEQLKSVDISNWDTSSAENMNGMFRIKTSSPLEEVILGEYFMACSKTYIDNNGVERAARDNMFGLETSPRSSKITINAPTSAKESFDDKKYPDQVKWETKGYFQNIILPHNESVNSPVDFSFELGGAYEAAGLEFQIGFYNLEPTSDIASRFTPSGTKEYNGKNYTLYTYQPTDAEKAGKSIMLTLNPTTEGEGYVYLNADGKFDEAISSKAKIAATPFLVDLWYDQSDNGKMVSLLNDIDLTGKNWPVMTQEGKLTFYLSKKVGDGEIQSVRINQWECQFDNTAEEKSGYYAYTMKNNQVISGFSGNVELAVEVLQNGESIWDNVGDATVKVYNLKKGEAMTKTNGDNTFDTSKVYYIMDDGMYLTNNLSVTDAYPNQLRMTNEITFRNIWRFTSPGRTTRMQHVDTQKYIKKSGSADVILDNSGQDVLVDDGILLNVGTASSKNYFKYDPVSDRTKGWIYYIRCKGNAPTGRKWTLIPLTITEPTD